MIDCGATLFKDDWLRSEIGKASSVAKNEIEGTQLATIHGSIEQCLRDDMVRLCAPRQLVSGTLLTSWQAWLKKQPLVREGLRQAIRGFMFDIKTGRLHEVS